MALSLNPRLVIVLVLLLATVGRAGDALQTILAQQAAHPKGDAPGSFDQSVYEEDTRLLPVGVFDSGIGGLTVLDAVLRLDAFKNDNLQPGGDGLPDFQAERFVYFGDQANMPYGNYASVGREDLLRELILRDAVFLLGKGQGRPGVKAIVIACNTATAFGLEDIRAAVKTWKVPVPVIGVVEAGSRGVTELLPSSSRPDAVAVLATVGTCSCEAYPRAISKTTGMAGKPMPVIIQQGCVGLAGAIEGDPAFVCSEAARPVPYQGPKPDAAMMAVYGFDPAGMKGDELNSIANHVRYEVATLVEKHRRSGDDTPIGTVVLGCTHFPLAIEEIREAFAKLREYREVSGAQPYKTLIRETLQFINPAEFTAKELFRELARAKLRIKADEHSLLEHDAFFMSVPNPEWPGVKLTGSGALDPEWKHGRALGDFSRLDVRQVPMTRALLPATTAKAIEHLMPQIWRRLN